MRSACNKGYDYARVSNPTRTALQLCLASLEGAEHGVAFSSGLGGGDDDHAPRSTPASASVAVGDVYGGVYRDVLAGLRAEGLRRSRASRPRS